MTTILVIEDEDKLREDILTVLNLEGYTVVGAADGAEGLKLATANPPELIVCDILMPNMNGYQTLEHIRQNPDTVSIPFIFLTALSEREDQRKGMELSADDYVTKPFTVEELLKSIQIRLQKRSQATAEVDAKAKRLRESITMALPHELRTPLNLVLGFSEILMTDTGLAPERVPDIAKYIFNAGQRLLRVIENFLLYTQLENLQNDAGQLAALAARPTEFSNFVIQSQAQEQAQQHKRPDDLTVETGADAPLEVYEDFWKKIVAELTDNAFKFSDAGTPVQIRGQRQDEQYVLQVTDHGRGMTPGQIKQIGAQVQFDRDRYEQQGLGMGLAILKRITQLYGGSLNIQSAPDAGTTVTVTVPVKTV